MFSCCRTSYCYIVTIFFAAFAVLLPSGTAGAEQPPDNSVQTARLGQIIFIIIDGLDEKALQKGQAPNIISLGQSGLKVQDVYPVLPDQARPVAASILTGLEPARHGYIDSGDVLRGDSLLDRLEAKGYKTALFDGSGGMLEPIGKKCSYKFKDNFQAKDRLVMDQVIHELEKKKIYLSVIFLPQLKIALEKYGYESKEFIEAVGESDNQVGRLIHFLRRSGQYENCLLVITGTAGAPPLIMKGPGIKNGAAIPAAGLVDIAPTVAKVAGLQGGQESGLILWDALQPGGEQSGNYLLTQRVIDLSRAYNEARREIYLTQEERINVEKSHSRLASEKNLVLKEIGRRDQQIDRLELKIKVMKYAGFASMVFFVVFCLLEYRYLKKKFLIFS